MGPQSGLGVELEAKTAPADHHATSPSPRAASGEDLHRQVSMSSIRFFFLTFLTLLHLFQGPDG